MKKFCPNCGKELKPNAAFCANCGFKIPAEKPTQPSQPTQISVVKKTEPERIQPTQPIKPSQPVSSQPEMKKTEPQKPQIFCPSCGHPLKPNATFCSNCGYNLVTKKAPGQSKLASQPTQVRPAPAARQSRKPMQKKTKIILGVVGVLAIIFIGFYAWGSHYYSKNNQIDRITTALRNPKQDISQYVEADTPDMKVTANSLKPLQNYYQEHQTAVTKMNSTLKYSDYANKYISLVKSGRNLLLFPKYKLHIKTFQPQVETNHGDSTVTVNGQDIGKLSGDSGKYYKKLNLVFPGKYHFNVKSKVAGRVLTATSTANIWGNKTLNMNIETQTFSVKSVPGGQVYINDKKVGDLDKDGKATFESYPITKNMELYVTYNTGNKTIKSEIVRDMAESFGTFDNYDSGYDDDDDYNDDASDTSSDDVTKEDGEYVVQPKWKGVISTDDAESLLGDVFKDADDSDDDFVDGASNKDYSDLKQQQKSWDDNDDIDSWDTSVDVEAVYPEGDDSCSVIFKVTYKFDNGDSTKTQVMEFKGAEIQKDGSKQKIKTIGKGKMISSKDEDD
ncbi:MAG: zinc-ribbon domain-containing protein [Candidatus Lactobacillus pullistercoris]|uniref:Zinc-ribbon domain-containing protein n=1 Tax=Candidatus Lactobacillus pullistercoris TaxID=2838636 RepID=A0A9E2KP18_9LACO|nr:zinc-ribbon domain-containing protein [Candidatus Lactobacillus pullistercoris]